jgi:hypothetical protein
MEQFWSPQTLHLPQSCGQALQSSPASQLLLPHATGHLPQSCGQALQLSPAWHWPLPQTAGQLPQSAGQVPQDSLPALHWPSPQTGPVLPHWPQFLQASTHRLSQADSQQKVSASHTHFSQLQPLQPGLLLTVQPSLQVPQSLGHRLQLSLPLARSQAPSPQITLQPPQSPGQLLQDSTLGSHLPSPQPGQGPQSAGQASHDSSLLQVPSPQPGWTGQTSK